MNSIDSLPLGIPASVSPDLICFCHLKWDFVYQRPQHLMKRISKKYRSFFVEEPVYYDGPDKYILRMEGDIRVVQFKLEQSLKIAIPEAIRQRGLLQQLIQDQNIKQFIVWYYTPMALQFSRHLKPVLTVYDCMDELSAFKFAPPELKMLEDALLQQANVVFTGGHSLYEAKKHLHSNIYPFPSSIDKSHFEAARSVMAQPADQDNIPGKRLGFYGVIDERFNIQLIKEAAEQRPDWQFVLVGPVVKIEESSLPRLQNIHYLGSKTYDELPVYLSGWDIAMIPFEKNESTQFISPTKTPEYLAAGKPVISTSITDVVNPYKVNNLVHIADNAEQFIKAAEQEFNRSTTDYNNWLERVDEFLSAISWDITAANMLSRMQACIQEDKINDAKKVASLQSVA